MPQAPSSPNRGKPLLLVGAFGLGLLVPFVLSARLQSPEAQSEGALGRIVTSRRTPVVQVAEAASPAVVAIEVERGRSWSFRPGRFSGEGSGVLINERGFVLTNHHVIRNADAIRVLLKGGKKAKAVLVALSEESDLALLRVESSRRRYPHVPLGDSSSLLPGETVVALGNPYGLQHTVSTGVVSAVRRSVRLPNSEEYNEFIQTDAAINPGNSGGALVNLHGELVGINTAIFNQGWGIAFAIPVDRIREILGKYVYKEHYIGLEVVPRNEGLKVVSAHPDGPAYKAGVRVGDILKSADGIRLVSQAALTVAALGAEASLPLHLRLTRSGRERTVKVDAISLLWDRMGIRGSSQLLRIGSESHKRLRVEQVRANSPAESLELRSGDVLYRVTIESGAARQSEGVEDEADLAQLLERYPGRRWNVEILRRGRVYEGTVTPRR